MDWNCMDRLDLFFFLGEKHGWRICMFSSGKVGWKKNCGKANAHRCQSQDNSRPREKYCMANESGAHMARAEDFIFDEYVTRDKIWPQTRQGGGFLFARLAGHV